MAISLPLSAICTVCRPSKALAIGAVGGIVACLGCSLLERIKIDDPVGCIPVHLFSGVWSLVAVAAFVEKHLAEQIPIGEGILKVGRWKLLGVQVLLSVCCIAWAGGITFLLFFVINKITPVRVSADEELEGADSCEHGIKTSYQSVCCDKGLLDTLNKLPGAKRKRSSKTEPAEIVTYYV